MHADSATASRRKMNAHYLAGLSSGLALIIAIGAQNAFVLRQGLRREHLLPIVLICACADLTLIAAGIAGLGLMIERYPALLTLARYGGAAFLLLYGLSAARRAWSGETLTVAENSGVSLFAAVTTCLALTFLNPHVYLDPVVLLGALANQHGVTGRWWFGLGAASASFIWFFALAYGARLLTPFFQQKRAWQLLDSGVAIVMVTLACGLASPVIGNQISAGVQPSAKVIADHANSMAAPNNNEGPS